MSLKQRNAIVIAVLAFGVLLSFKGGNSLLTLGLSIIVILLSPILHLKLIRCPHCGVWLGKMIDSHCPKCGKEIDQHAKY